MKTYIKFFFKIYFTSLFNVTMIMLSLVFILNLLSELDFFRNIKSSSLLYFYQLLTHYLIYEVFHSSFNIYSIFYKTI